jgi:hypothetical protein
MLDIKGKAEEAMQLLRELVGLAREIRDELRARKGLV